MISQRLALIEPLLNLFHTEVNLRMHLHPGGCQALQSQHNMRDQRTCNMVILGELWRRLHWLGRTAMPSRAPQVSESVQDIRGVLYETLVYNFETLGGHGACGPSGKHGQKLAKISDQWVDLDMLPGAFRLQVKRHRERLGFMGKRPQE